MGGPAYKTVTPSVRKPYRKLTIVRYTAVVAAKQFRVYEVVNLDLAKLVIGIAGPATNPTTLIATARRPGWRAGHVEYRVVGEHPTLSEAAEASLPRAESAPLKA